MKPAAAQTVIPVPAVETPFWQRIFYQRLLLVILSGLALVSMSPAFQRIPSLDSGNALYAGAQILQGKLPYTDFWAARPPLLYAINAVGLGLGGRWGVWALEWVALAFAALLCHAFLRRWFSGLAAWLAALIMVLNLAYFFREGNTAGEYALPLLWLALLWTADLVEGRPAVWRGMGIGLALGAASALWQPLAGLGLTIALVLMIQAFLAPDGVFRKEGGHAGPPLQVEVRHAGPPLQMEGRHAGPPLRVGGDTRVTPLRRVGQLVAKLLWIGLGFALAWAAVAGVFARAGSLSVFWTDAFLVPFVYSSAATLAKISAVWAALSELTQLSGMLLLGLAGWLAAIPFLLLNHAAARRLAFGRVSGMLTLVVALFLLTSGLIDDSGHLYALNALSLYRFVLIAAGLLLLAAGILILTGWVSRRYLPRLQAYQGSAGAKWGLPLLVALVDLPLELALTTFFWRSGVPSFVNLLPGLTILLAFILDGALVYGALRGAKYARFFWMLPLGVGMLVSGIWASVYANLNAPWDALLDVTVSKALDTLAGPNQGKTFLQWGEENRLYFITGRPAPTRYGDVSLLFGRSPLAQPARAQFLAELQAARPALILDTRGEDYPLIIPDGQCARLDDPAFISDWLAKDQKVRYRYTEKPLPSVPEEMVDIYRWVCENYEFAGTTGLGQWNIYALKNQ